MAEITASMVKELRERTDAPMMECKRALTEAAGDLNKAEEVLRVKLGSKASKAASRITAEGVVAIHLSADGKVGALVEVNSETDFVAKNDEFLKLASDCAALVASHDPADVAALSALPMGDGSVESTRTAWWARLVKTCRFGVSCACQPQAGSLRTFMGCQDRRPARLRGW
jgi:elongation factor Ts